MQKEILELGEKLNNILQDMVADCEGVESQVTFEVVNELKDRLIYGLSIVFLHDAYYLFGSTIGGGYEFIDQIDEDDFTETIADRIVVNFTEMDLKLI